MTVMIMRQEQENAEWYFTGVTYDSYEEAERVMEESYDFELTTVNRKGIETPIEPFLIVDVKYLLDTVDDDSVPLKTEIRVVNPSGRDLYGGGDYEPYK